MTQKDFFELRSFLRVAHHIPGRIRLKFDADIRHHPAAQALVEAAGHATDFPVATIRLNLPARSLVIEYDTARIAPEDIDIFMNSKDMQAVHKTATSVSRLFGMTLPPFKED